MAVRLNLLPQELAVGTNTRGAIKTLRALSVIGVAAFLIFGIGVAIFFITSTISLNKLKSNITKLTSQVSALQKSEQQIVLVKDRLAKIVSIQNLPNSMSNQVAVEPLLASISENSSVSELEINPKSIRMTVIIRTNPGLSTFIESLQSSTVFKSVSLVSLSYNPTNGYSAEINADK